MQHETLGIGVLSAPGVGMRVCGMARLATAAAVSRVALGSGGTDGGVLCAVHLELRHWPRPCAAAVGQGDVQRWQLVAHHSTLPLHAVPGTGRCGTGVAFRTPLPWR